MNDTLQAFVNLSDTIKVVTLSQSTQPFIRLEYLGLLGVILGAIISTIGNLILSKRNAKIQIKSVLFQKRLDVYTKIVELSWEGYSVVEDFIDNKKVNYPQAYKSPTKLLKWLNSMVEVMDKSRFLLDQATYTKFNHLNWKLLEHINLLKQYKNKKIRISETKKLGVSCVGEIQNLTEEFVDAARQYMNKKYDVGFEKVT
jgi:hypothetical protein